MAETNDKVMQLVASELTKNPDATTEELQSAAKKKFPSVAKLSKRQFNARYALQIKRKLPGAKKAAPKKAGQRKRAPARSASGKTGQAKARKAPAASSRTRRSSAAAPATNRDAIRVQFLRFASDITGAESRNDLVKVLASVDKYVDAVAGA